MFYIPLGARYYDEMQQLQLLSTDNGKGQLGCLVFVRRSDHPEDAVSDK